MLRRSFVSLTTAGASLITCLTRESAFTHCPPSYRCRTCIFVFFVSVVWIAWRVCRKLCLVLHPTHAPPQRSGGTTNFPNISEPGSGLKSVAVLYGNMYGCRARPCGLLPRSGSIWQLTQRRRLCTPFGSAQGTHGSHLVSVWLGDDAGSCA